MTYYLLFRNCKNEEVWRHVFDQTLECSTRSKLGLPLVTPFKFAHHFLLETFPEWEDHVYYRDLSWHADTYFNTLYEHGLEEQHEDWMEFK
jgi:hypothetical protein